MVMERNLSERRSVLDLIRSSFGEDLCPDLIAAIPSVPASTLEAFSRSVREAEYMTLIPEKGQTELRPFLTFQALEEVARTKGLRLTTDGAFREDRFRQGPMADFVKLHLLYCHGVALFDPLPYIADYFVAGDPGFSGPRYKLQNYLAWLHELKPLVAAGIITFVSEFAYKYHKPGLPKRPLSLFSSLETDDVSQLSQELSLQEYPSLGNVSESERQQLIKQADTSITVTMILSAEQRGAIDLYFPGTFYEPVIRKIIERQGVRPSTSGIDLAVLGRLLNVSVPGLENLSSEDVCRIRLEEDVFEQWRGSLRSVLQLLHEQRKVMLNSESDALRMAREELRPSANSLGESLGKSSWGSRARAGTKGFVIGGIAGSVTAAVTGQPAALITPMVTALLSFLWSGRDIRSRDTQEAALRHYLLFG